MPSPASAPHPGPLTEPRAGPEVLCCPHLCGLQAKPAPPDSSTSPSPNHPGLWGLPELPLSPATHLKLPEGRSHLIGPQLKPSEGLPGGIEVQTRPLPGCWLLWPFPSPTVLCLPFTWQVQTHLPEPVTSKWPSLTPAHSQGPCHVCSPLSTFPVTQEGSLQLHARHGPLRAASVPPPGCELDKSRD